MEVQEEHRLLETDRDVEEVLKLAIRDTGDGSDLRERLHRSAAELGISDDALERAMADWAEQKTAQQQLDEFKANQKREFVQHLYSYVGFSAFFLFMDFWTGDGLDWFFFPILGWGIGIAVHAICTFLPGSKSFQDSFEKWKKEKA